MRLVCVITLTLLTFRWVFDFREICARLMCGNGSTSPFDFNINIRWSCRLFSPPPPPPYSPAMQLLTPVNRRQRRPQIPSGRFGELKNFVHGKQLRHEPSSAVYMSFAPSSRTQQQSCM